MNNIVAVSNGVALLVGYCILVPFGVATIDSVLTRMVTDKETLAKGRTSFIGLATVKYDKDGWSYILNPRSENPPVSYGPPSTYGTGDIERIEE